MPLTHMLKNFLKKSNGLESGLDGEEGSSQGSWLKRLLQPKEMPDFRETIEEYIEVLDEQDHDAESIAAHERLLISNVLRTRDMSVLDVMIPRADIAAISIDSTQ